MIAHRPERAVSATPAMSVVGSADAPTWALLQAVVLFAVGLMLMILLVAGITVDWLPIAALQFFGSLALMIAGPALAIVLASERRARP
jgi:hypothetical protein